MARSVVLKGTVRCAGCQLPPRWCICPAMTPVTGLPFDTEVLMHFKEAYRPSSTGHLIGRLVPGAVIREYRSDLPFVMPADVSGERRPLWVLHPAGDPVSTTAPAGLRVMLIDGSWKQAAGMMQAVSKHAQCIRLPMTGESRYRLRTQQEGGRFSTIEALMFLCDALGATDTARALRLRFELHVYAGLLSRGRVAEAADYLRTSPAATEWPELVRKLQPARATTA
ncbi:MAG: tRNA-uridine aminocarboxypropyltransferase [Verrucomicrobiota bacterium]